MPPKKKSTAPNAGAGNAIPKSTASARPASARPASARPASARPASARPASARPASRGVDPRQVNVAARNAAREAKRAAFAEESACRNGQYDAFRKQCHNDHDKTGCSLYSDKCRALGVDPVAWPIFPFRLEPEREQQLMAHFGTDQATGTVDERVGKDKMREARKCVLGEMWNNADFQKIILEKCPADHAKWLARQQQQQQQQYPNVAAVAAGGAPKRKKKVAAGAPKKKKVVRRVK
jgi:hypothetical protein